MASLSHRLSPNFEDAWVVFTDELKLAFRAPTKRPAPPPAVAAQVQFAAACAAVGTLLREVDLEDEGVKFQTLALAFFDLAGGTSNPLLKPAVRNRGAPKDTKLVWKLRADVCVGLEYMLAAGLSTNEAISRITRKHGKDLSRLVAEKADLKKSLRSWHKSFKSHTVRSVAAMLVFESLVKTIEHKADCPGEVLQRMGEVFIEQAAADARQRVGF